MQTRLLGPDGCKLPGVPTGCIERAQRSAALHGSDGADRWAAPTRPRSGRSIDAAQLPGRERVAEFRIH